MAIPTIVEIFPADSDSGIPVGETFHVIFSRGIDLEVAKENVVLYGPDTDISSGPDSAQWIDPEAGTNPFFLRSPNFRGIVDCTYETVYVDSEYEEISPQPLISTPQDEIDGEYLCKLKITPVRPLAGDATYTLHIVGDPDATNRGICSRTVFDVTQDEGNQSTTGTVVVLGGYIVGDDTLNIEITTSGGIGTAKYRWWFTSAGIGEATTGKLTSRRFRQIEDRVQIRFDGTGFIDGDVYIVELEAPERLASSVSVSFTTNDGSYSVAPESPSTPATSTPPTSTVPGLTSDGGFYAVSSIPSTGDTNQPLSERTIVVTFSAAIDPDTVTDDVVTVKLYPVSGVYGDTYQPISLSKKLTVSGSTLTIEI